VGVGGIVVLGALTLLLTVGGMVGIERRDVRG